MNSEPTYASNDPSESNPGFDDEMAGVLVVGLLGGALGAPQFPSSPQPPLRPFQPSYRPPFRGPSTPPPPPPIFASPSPSPFPSPLPTIPPPTPGIYKPVVKDLQPGTYYAILKQAQDTGFDGTFNYEFETENGIQTQASGALKNPGTPDEAQVIQGGYAYTSPDGIPISVQYVADETGFHPVGAHLPIPEAIARSLEYLRSLPPSKDDQLRRK